MCYRENRRRIKKNRDLSLFVLKFKPYPNASVYQWLKMFIFCVLHAKINAIFCSRAGGAKKIKKMPCFIDIYPYIQAFLYVFTRQKPYPYPYPPIQNLTHFLTPVPSNFFLTLLLKTLPYGKQNGPIGNSGFGCRSQAVY